jgi:hypothetical protein
MRTASVSDWAAAHPLSSGWVLEKTRNRPTFRVAQPVPGPGLCNEFASVLTTCMCVLQGTAFADDTAEAHAVPHAGDYHFRANPGAEKHLNDPAAVAALQAAVQVCILYYYYLINILLFIVVLLYHCIISYSHVTATGITCGMLCQHCQCPDLLCCYHLGMIITLWGGPHSWHSWTTAVALHTEILQWGAVADCRAMTVRSTGSLRR